MTPVSLNLSRIGGGTAFYKRSATCVSWQFEICRHNKSVACVQETPLYNDEDADRPFSIFYGVKCDEFVKDQNVILLPADCSIKKAVSVRDPFCHA